MTYDFTPLEYYQTKFYQKEGNFKKFANISEEQLSLISKKLYKNQEKCNNTPLNNLDKYKKILQYISNPLIHLDLNTFDERIAYLIMAIDPNLIMFKEFLKIDLISIDEINKTKNEKEKIHLKKLRNQTISIYENTVREKIGFFDVKLLKYEEMFFKKFFNEKELITEVKKNNHVNLHTKIKSLKDFNNISNERYQELKNIAQTYLSLIKNSYNYQVVTYNIFNQKKLLKLNTLEEQLALLILIIDSNLDMLKIHEEESRITITEERITEQFGFFNKDLLILEQKFYDRFCPEQPLSIWSKTKNRKK